MSSNNVNKIQELELRDENISALTEDKKTYRLANIYRVLFARLFDFILASLPGFIVGIILKPGSEANIENWSLMFATLGTNLAFLTLYFVIIPFFLNGNTLGKIIFRIKMVQEEDKKITFGALAAREAFFILIPWAVTLITQIIAFLIFKQVDVDQENSKAIYAVGVIIGQIGYLLFAGWLILIGLSIKVQDQQQSFIDIKFGIFVVNAIAEEDKVIIKKEKQDKKLSREDKHISLTEQPGNFNQEMIDEIYVSEREEFKKSINVEKQNLIENLKIEQAKKKEIEMKGDKKDDE
ncbi:RDD family protein [[Acholeplasma] multilocale]|uniref:RDD family protein n=1 Tax=[Acholeplasma] multilocale TaxID=264638 RepID=UPI00047892A6|nr:RDD family protein [[Acholeplasma] multilocale]